MNTNKRLSLNLPAPLKEHQLEERFDSFLDDTTESIEFMGITLIPHRFLKDNDETAYRCAFNDWLDNEIRCDDIKEYDGSYYDKDDFESSVEETKDEASAEVDALEAELEEADEDRTETINEELAELISEIETLENL